MRVSLEWFKIHADQRLRVFNFFILMAGFCIGGYFTALQQKLPSAALVISIFLLALCLCFKLLDIRTAHLVKVGENSLEHLLNELCDQIDRPELNVLKNAAPKPCMLSYRQIFNIIFVLFGLLSAVGVFASWFIGIR